MSSRQIQLSSSEEKGKALEVARTAGSADAFPVHRERHYGMEVRNGRDEEKYSTRVRKKKWGHIQISTLETQHRPTNAEARSARLPAQPAD
jgi:hypothetical protein